MSSMFIKVLNLSINASWLIMAILLLRPLLRKAPKWLHCALWAIVAVRLLLPFSIESALSVLPGSEVIPQDIVTTKIPAIHSQIMTIDNAVNPIMLRELAPKAESSVNPMQVIASVAGTVWIIGVGICLAYALISYLFLKKKVSAAVAMGNGVMACDEIRTPFILGIIRPMIYVPSSMAGRTLEVVLAHEKAHLKRMDHLWKPLGFLLFSVYWFNPLCLIAYVLLCRDIEAACDEKVIRNQDKKFAADYSQALLDLSMPRRMITVCPLAFGETGVKGRVKGVLNYRKPAFWVTLIALVTCVLVAIYFMTSPVTKISKDAERVTSIKVFDGTCGKELIITDRGEIEKIVAYINEMKLSRGKVSIGYMGYQFHLTFQPKWGTWDDFIVGPDVVRNDPFFYSLETETGLIDYIEELYVSHGVKEPSKGEEQQAQGNGTENASGKQDATANAPTTLPEDVSMFLAVIDENGNKKIVPYEEFSKDDAAAIELIKDFVNAVNTKDLEGYISLFDEENQREMRRYIAEMGEDTFYAEENRKLVKIERYMTAPYEKTGGEFEDAMAFRVTEQIAYIDAVTSEMDTYPLISGETVHDYVIVKEKEKWKLYRISVSSDN